MEPDAAAIRRAVAAALAEDLDAAGDVTSLAMIPPDARAEGRLLARQRLVLSGLAVAREVFRTLDPDLEFVEEARDGDTLDDGAVAARVRGAARPILAGERTALNFLMRMSGIATASRAAVDEVAGTGARVLDTRKTAPGLRGLDKYAVACGGASNHRMGLFDAAMIKDTHLGAHPDIDDAVRRLRAAGLPSERITVEVRDLDQLDRAIAAGAGRALLDNMDLPAMRGAVERAAGRIRLEASGGLRPGRLRAVAETGVDDLSLGWLTHSAPAADLSMSLERL